RRWAASTERASSGYGRSATTPAWPSKSLTTCSISSATKARWGSPPAATCSKARSRCRRCCSWSSGHGTIRSAPTSAEAAARGPSYRPRSTRCAPAARSTAPCKWRGTSLSGPSRRLHRYPKERPRRRSSRSVDTSWNGGTNRDLAVRKPPLGRALAIHPASFDALGHLGRLDRIALQVDQLALGSCFAHVVDSDLLAL